MGIPHIGDLPYGDLPYGDPPYGDLPYGDPPYGDPPYGDPPYTGSAIWGSAIWGSAIWGSAISGSPIWGSAKWGSAIWGPPYVDLPYGDPPIWGSAIRGSPIRGSPIWATWVSAIWGSAIWGSQNSIPGPPSWARRGGTASRVRCNPNIRLAQLRQQAIHASRPSARDKLARSRPGPIVRSCGKRARSQRARGFFGCRARAPFVEQHGGASLLPHVRPTNPWRPTSG